MEQILLSTLGLISEDWATTLMSFMQQGGQILWWLGRRRGGVLAVGYGASYLSHNGFPWGKKTAL